MKYRSRTDVVADILRSCENTVPWTKVMYTAYVSYVQMKEYMPLLEDKGFLTIGTDKTVTRTRKGTTYLAKLDAVRGEIAPPITSKKGTAVKSGN